MVKNKVVVLGAGLAGLSAAWHLKERGIRAPVFEKENTAGGLCRSKQIKGFVFDYDGHLLHFRDNYARRLVQRLLKGNLARHQRSAWINNFGILSQYPFQANLHALPKPIAIECLWGFIQINNSRTNNSCKNFLKWINTAFGKGIARHFMIPYNRKFWATSLSRMSCPWSDKFIPQPNLSGVVNGFFNSNKNRFGYNAIFWYPKKGGIGQLARVFEEQVGGISKNCRISRIDLRKKEVTITGMGKKRFDNLILTIPLPELIKIVKPLPDKIAESLKKLRWNSIFNLNLGVEGPCQNGKHWVYFPHKETVFFRAGFFHNFSASAVPSGKSSLYVEVSYSKDKPINRAKITKQAINDLYKIGILNKKNKVSVLDVNDIKYGYPIYDRHHGRATQEIKNFLLSHNIITCGRYGSWQYMSMEDAILDGRRAAEEIKL